jgi:membrane associated rhomboid family serine protease
VREQDDLTFLQMLWTRPVRVTYIVFAFNIVIFVLMTLAGGSTNPRTLLAFGMKDNNLIDAGEVWRLVTPIFIHIGVLHMFFNSYSLWIVGPHVEKLYGGARFFILYVLAGIGGVVASYWYNPSRPSAGASGAIFGLFGVLLVFVIKYRNSIPPQFRSALGRGIFLTLAINLVIGFSVQFVDNSAHIGGLICGATLAALIPYARPMSETSGIYKIIQGVLVITVAASFVQAAVSYNGPGLSIPNPTQGWFGGSSRDDSDFLGAVSAADNAFQDSASQLPFARSTDFTNMRRTLSDAASRLKRVSPSASGAEAIRREWLSLIDSQYGLVGDVELSGGLLAFEHKLRLEDNQRRFKQARERVQTWLSREQERRN